MKWIKTNEEYNFVDEIQSFCDNHLAYLIDNGIKVVVPRKYDMASKMGIFDILIGNLNTSIGNHINFNHSANTIGLKWSDIKDDIIPFIAILKDKYNIEYITFKKLDTHTKYAPIIIEIDDIIDDKVGDIDEIYYIRITIKNK